ncbi:MAG TPA: OmpH family outer membrane protein [Verrucomicrobiae bacterium]|jgi:outer membrane protein|nr:OmpH family outer membrane protein [Verrucomicrobiae bacterium]
MKAVRIYATAIVLIFTAAAFAKPLRAAEPTYVYVDVAVLFDEYQKTKDNDEVLKNLGQSKEQERDTLVNEVRAIKDEMVLLNDDAKTAKQEALDEKIRKLQDFDQSAKRELGEKRNKLVREIFKDIDDTVQRFGERKGYDMILNERALLYRNPKLDVTQEILKELNKGYKKA